MSDLIRQGDANLAAFGQFGNSVTTADTLFNTLPAGRVIVAITALNGVTGITTKGETASFPDLSSTPVPVGVTIFGRYTSVTSLGGPAIVYFG